MHLFLGAVWISENNFQRKKLSILWQNVPHTDGWNGFLENPQMNCHSRGHKRDIARNKKYVYIEIVIMALIVPVAMA